MLVRRDTQGQPGKAGSFLGGALVSELDLRLGRTIEFGLLITMICLKEHCSTMYMEQRPEEYLSSKTETLGGH